MGVALRRVEEKIADAGTGDVLRLRRDVGEDDTRGHFRTYPPQCRLLEVAFAQVRETEEPEDGFGKARKDAEPGPEGRGLNLGCVSAAQRVVYGLRYIPCRAD